jgi:hypothetical protein
MIFVINKSLNGKRIKMINMKEDPHPIEPGTLGTIRNADPMCISVDWDNGRGLGVIPEVDEFEILEETLESTK